MRVLIAGAGGLGLRVAHLLRAQGSVVTALTRSGGNGCNAIDLLDAQALSPYIADADAIIFSAAPSTRSEHAYRSLYIDGLKNILEARHLQPVLFCSSTAVYGENSGGWVDESAITQPDAYNGRVLVEAENLLSAGDLALRLGGLYGPRFMPADGANNVRDFARRQALAGAVPLAQHWTNRINLLDAARAIVFALKLPARPLKLNIVDDEPCTQQTLYDWHRISAGLLPIPALTSAMSGKRVSNALLRQLGFACQFPSFREGYTALPRTR